jgi:hypothetical protein
MAENRDTGGGRRGLFARVMERRRLEASSSAEEATPEAEAESGDPYGDRIAALESRLDHLESLVEGLQDAMHRDSVRREQEIQALEQKTSPAWIARSLAEHDRERGL